MVVVIVYTVARPMGGRCRHRPAPRSSRASRILCPPPVHRRHIPPVVAVVGAIVHSRDPTADAPTDSSLSRRIRPPPPPSSMIGRGGRRVRRVHRGYRRRIRRRLGVVVDRHVLAHFKLIVGSPLPRRRHHHRHCTNHRTTALILLPSLHQCDYCAVHPPPSSLVPHPLTYLSTLYVSTIVLLVLVPM